MAETTPEEREALYDAEIAPALLALSKKCQDAGMSFVADVEWDASTASGGKTLALCEGSSFAIRLVDCAIKSMGNVDTLCMALLKYADEHGHGSIFIHMIQRHLKSAESTNV